MPLSAPERERREKIVDQWKRDFDHRHDEDRAHWEKVPADAKREMGRDPGDDGFKPFMKDAKLAVSRKDKLRVGFLIPGDEVCRTA